MVQTTQEKLMQEKVNLWRAKALHRQMVGDDNWMPCAAVETKDDWDLFEPKPKPAEEQSKKRKRGADPTPLQNGVVQQDASEVNGADSDQTTNVDQNQNTAGGDALPDETEGDATSKAGTDNIATTEQPQRAEDVDMQDSEPTINGLHTNPTSTEDPRQEDTNISDIDKDLADPAPDGEPSTAEPNDPNSTASSPRSTPPPPRRITRALAAETNPASGVGSPPVSPSLTMSTMTSDLLEPDPIFLLPPHLNRSHPPLPIPVDELLETRRLLTMYIQKQEETIRSTENVLNKLLKAKHLRDRVFEWCKAEGHVGEWSDGEDWIDAEYWGEREEDIVKGAGDEEVGAQNDGDGGVGIQGGKKKRRGRRGERD